MTTDSDGTRTRFAHYQAIEDLDSSGSAELWHGWDPYLGRYVVIASLADIAPTEIKESLADLDNALRRWTGIAAYRAEEILHFFPGSDDETAFVVLPPKGPPRRVASGVAAPTPAASQVIDFADESSVDQTRGAPGSRPTVGRTGSSGGEPIPWLRGLLAALVILGLPFLLMYCAGDIERGCVGCGEVEIVDETIDDPAGLVPVVFATPTPTHTHCIQHTPTPTKKPRPKPKQNLAPVRREQQAPPPRPTATPMRDARIDSRIGAPIPPAPIVQAPAPARVAPIPIEPVPIEPSGAIIGIRPGNVTALTRRMANAGTLVREWLLRYCHDVERRYLAEGRNFACGWMGVDLDGTLPELVVRFTQIDRHMPTGRDLYSKKQIRLLCTDHCVTLAEETTLAEVY